MICRYAETNTPIRKEKMHPTYCSLDFVKHRVRCFYQVNCKENKSWTRYSGKVNQRLENLNVQKHVATIRLHFRNFFHRRAIPSNLICFPQMIDVHEIKTSDHQLREKSLCYILKRNLKNS